MRIIILTCLFLITVLSAAGDLPAADMPDSYPRTVLIEEYTGAWCGWCPDGADTLKAITGDTGNVAVLAYHIGDALEIKAGRKLRDHYKSNYPQAVFDRSPVSDSPELPVSRGAWRAAVALRANERSPLSLDCQSLYDAVTGEVSLRVIFCLAEAIPYQCRLHIAVTEDSISVPQSAFNRPEKLLDPYYHMHVVRDVPYGMYGRELDLAHAGAQSCFMESFVFPLRNVSRPEYSSVVVFMSEGGAASFGPVIQAARTGLAGDH